MSRLILFILRQDNLRRERRFRAVALLVFPLRKRKTVPTIDTGPAPMNSMPLC
jgi:hypothetical protein